jgi:eukaryotic-like serine/threonine-protein kinase
MAGEQINLPLGEAVVSWRGVSYINLEKRGKGGSAVVYRTIATTGQRRGVTFAVKLFRAATREGWHVNFMREIHVLRDCDHPAIMKVYDEGMYLDEYPFVVMEYLPLTLKDRLQAQGVAIKEKTAMMLHLLSALNYLSRREPPVVHRDIKPQNIFIKEHACVLGDFGLILQIGEREDPVARGRGRGVEMAQMYRTPELIDYHNGGPEPPAVSDVFQLGLVAAELFTGLNPLQHAGPSKPIELKEISGIEGRFGKAIRVWIERMLMLRTSDRPAAFEVLSGFQELYRAMHQQERRAKSAEVPKMASKAPPLMTERPGDEQQQGEATKRLSFPARKEFGEGILGE